MSQFNPYQILGVSIDAGMDEILAAFRFKVQNLSQSTNVTDPAYGKQLGALRQAVSMLTDPNRRKQVDAEITRFDGPLNPGDLKYLWQMVAKLFFERTNRHTPASDALRASSPITLEGDNLLIVGLDPMQGHLLNYLATGESHGVLQRILSELCARPMDFRVIASTSLTDWINLRDAEARASNPAPATASSTSEEGSIRQKLASKQTPTMSPLLSGIAKTAVASETAPSAASVEEWDDVMDTLMRVWSGTESRNFPQVRAQLIIDSLALVAQGEAKAREKQMPEDQLQRALARALDRIGRLTGSDSAMIGVLYLHLHPRQQGE